MSSPVHFTEPTETAVIGKARLHFKNASELQSEMQNNANLFSCVTSRASGVGSFI